jgi:hypothetical protein
MERATRGCRTITPARGDAGVRHDRAGLPARDLIIDDPLKPEEALSQAQPYFRKYPSTSCTSERHIPHAVT